MKKFVYSVLVMAVVVAALLWIFLPDSSETTFVAVAEPTTLRGTEGGEYVGFIDNYGARAWLGMAFAQPPTGELRWKAPQPPMPHQGTKEATRIGSACTQFASIIGPADDAPDENNVVGDEDCLYLNVWSAPNNHNAPVMFWIHGGGNTIGHGGSYNGAKLAATHNLVVVSINYRLGVLGWFQHPKVTFGSPAESSGNFGILDVVRALEWTRDNIAEFGGDPNNVTVFGESAGARNALALMASAGAKGLFHKAIVQSGGYWSSELSEAVPLEANGGHKNSSSEIINRVLSVSNQTASDVTEELTKATLRTRLESKSSSAIFAAVQDDGLSGMSDIPQLITDGYVVPNGSAEEIFGESGRYNEVPVILGTNRDEVALFLSFDPQNVESTLGVFRSLRNETEYLRRVYYGSQSWKVTGVDSLAQQMVAAGNSKVFAYRFDWDEEPDVFFFDMSTALGAAHGLELAFVFGDSGRGMNLEFIYPNDENQHRLSDSMMSYWAEFAHSGDPGRGRSGNETEWLAWSQQGKTTLLLDTQTDGGIRMMDEVVTFASLKQELLEDVLISDLALRCEIYLSTYQYDARSSVEEQESMGCDPSELLEMAME